MAYLNKITVFFLVFLALYTGLPQVKADECFSDADCPSSQYCCKRNSPEDNVCRFSCTGATCTVDNDCANGECCDADYTCKKSGECDFNKVLAGWIVAIIVISVVVAIVIPIAVVLYCCVCAASASRRRAHGGVIITQPATTGTIFLSNQQQQYPMEQRQPMYYQPNHPSPYPPQPYPPQGTVYPPVENLPTTMTSKGQQ